MAGKVKPANKAVSYTIEIMISLNKIFKKYGKGKKSQSVLSGFSSKIKSGEFIALLGPSGSGKTTLLNIIGGLDSPTKGIATFKQKNIHKLSDKKLSSYRNEEIGFIFQEFYLETNLSTLNNVLLPTYFNKNKEDYKEKAKMLLKEVGLEKKIHKKTKELSGGEKQRVAIARALINDPSIILADEPTGNLDKETGKVIINLLKSLHKNHKTTLIIATHDDKIAKAANKIIKL
jgi:ABC-type lipoprotein export system ATPase subunit